MILAIESGGDFVSVALGNFEFTSSVTLDTPRNSEELLKVVDYLCSIRNESPISAVAVCIGPGSYTGLRVGLACAQGLACGLDVPLIGISSFVAGMFSEKVLDGQLELGCLLREGEAARCKFDVTDNGKRLAQLGDVEFCSAEKVKIKRVDAEGLLRAAASVEHFVEFEEQDSHYVVTTGVSPLPLFYLKPVQAKTLLERAGQSNA